MKYLFVLLFYTLFFGKAYAQQQDSLLTASDSVLVPVDTLGTLPDSLITQKIPKLKFKLDESTYTLKSGDYLSIPAGTHHRVEWTDPNVKTVWLALHYDSEVKV